MGTRGAGLTAGREKAEESAAPRGLGVEVLAEGHRGPLGLPTQAKFFGTPDHHLHRPGEKLQGMPL